MICNHLIIFSIVISSNKCCILQIYQPQKLLSGSIPENENIFLKNNISNLHSEMAPSHYVSIHNLNNILEQKYNLPC